MAWGKSNETLIKELFLSTKVKDVMAKPAISVTVDDELSDVEKKFIKNHINHIVVVDGTNKVVGMISQKYLYKARSPRKIMDGDAKYAPSLDTIIDGDSYYLKETLDSYILENIMLKSPATLSEDASMSDVVKTMEGGKRGFIVIIDKNSKPVGVVTNHQILDFVGNFLK